MPFCLTFGWFYIILVLTDPFSAMPTSTQTKTEGKEDFGFDGDMDEPAIQLPIEMDDKETILLNVEGAVKQLISKIAKKQELSGDGYCLDEEEFAHLPNTLTGVVVYYLVKGLKFDFNIEFAEQPVCLKSRGAGSALDKKVAGKKRLLTKEQKNDLLARTNMSFYENDMSNGTITLQDAFASIEEAFTKKKEFESIGYMLPAKKTEYPYWKEEKVTETQTA